MDGWTIIRLGSDEPLPGADVAVFGARATPKDVDEIVGDPFEGGDA